jgi:hypothetical protein
MSCCSWRLFFSAFFLRNERFGINQARRSNIVTHNVSFTICAVIFCPTAVHFYNYMGNSWDWKMYPRTRYSSEYGFQSWSSHAALSKSFPPEDLRWDSPLMAHRQHHPGGQNELKFQVYTGAAFQFS